MALIQPFVGDFGANVLETIAPNGFVTIPVNIDSPSYRVFFDGTGLAFVVAGPDASLEADKTQTVISAGTAEVFSKVPGRDAFVSVSCFDGGDIYVQTGYGGV